MREIEVVSGKQLIILNQKIIQKLLLAVDECIEWGQIFILDYLATYDPADSK
jgi:AP-1 complex subunit beta-1